MNITDRLRSLQLWYISLDDLLMFLSSIYMPVLEKLIFIEIYDDTLNHLAEFQKYFQLKEKMPALHPSSLQFLLRFPGELEYEWKIHRSFEWPFETININYYLEEHCLSAYDYLWRAKVRALEKKYSLLIFTTSPLPYRRIVHNHFFSSKLKQQSQTSSITWTCDQIDNAQQLLDSLAKLKTAKEIVIPRWLGTESQNASAKLISFSTNLGQLRFDNLRSLSFFTATKDERFFLKSQYQNFLDLILQGAPRLVKLTINWNYVMCTDSIFNNGHFIAAPFLNLRHLHLYHNNRPKEFNLSNLINISILAQSFPRLISLWTSGHDLYPDENLAALISSFVIYFNELVEVIINKGSRYRHHGNADLEPLFTQQ
ncbi:unnamed protein product, partial [Rotaria sordida]